MRPSLSRRAGVWGVVLIAVLAAAGCGGGTAKISGKVLLKGAPLKGGMVTFVHQEGGNSGSAQIAEDGSYTVAKISPGRVKICVDTESLNPAKRVKAPTYGPPKGAGEAGGYNPGGGPPEDQSKRYVKIKAAYAKPETTDLAYVVKAGSQTYDIPLE
jgi:hypothetical protein